MWSSQPLKRAKQILHEAQGRPLTRGELCDQAILLARELAQAARRVQTASEKRQQGQLKRMMDDPNGKAFAVSLTDQCFRSEDPHRTANQVLYLMKRYGLPHFAGSWQKVKLELFRALGSHAHHLVPLLQRSLRKEMDAVLWPGEEKPLRRLLRHSGRKRIRTNINRLGEAILGDEEAKRRLDLYLDDLENPDVSYISVKISTLCSRIRPIAWEDTLERLANRLRLLYRRALAATTPKFINLDMEEYRDLGLTVELFQRVLDEPAFLHLSAGVALQAYLPDSFAIQQKLTEWAMKRCARGGAPIKVRLVRGANLAMEQVEASIRDWEQTPYSSKLEVDANYKRMVVYGCKREHAEAVHIGIASHNLFDIAYALLLRATHGLEREVEFEMLRGMCDHQRRIVQKLAGDILLYCPVARREDIPHAMAYLIRRLDENSGPENFLRHAATVTTGSPFWKREEERFRAACDQQGMASSQPRRQQDRLAKLAESDPMAPFAQEADTDWSLPSNRIWAERILQEWRERKVEAIPLVIDDREIRRGRDEAVGRDPSRPDLELYRYRLANEDDIGLALQAGRRGVKRWRERDRSKILTRAADQVRQRRGELIGAMIADGGKLIPEGDAEVSEAVDFIDYYRRQAETLFGDPTVTCKAKGVILVAPPWNFPCSIPAGGISAALAAGNAVIFKPAPEAVLVGWQLVQAFWEAGVPRDTLQFINCWDEPVGRRLIQHRDLAGVILTGASTTARLFYQLQPGLNLLAETGGKNALIVSKLADRDLAIQDAVASAFGHSGQKCSACSLLVLEGELYDDPRFLAQLRDAVASLKVGSAWDLASEITPLIRAPGHDLHRALTFLDAGESWLLEPRVSPENPLLWSPGIKLGVKMGSYSHQTEFFGPILSVMRAANMKEAIEIANGTPYGLTSGIHTLDDREIETWQQQVIAGNLYVNRGITGAIVQRQPFGGCKASGFGHGAKAGGPHYLDQLVHLKEAKLPKEKGKTPKIAHTLGELLEIYEITEEERDLYWHSVQSYSYWAEVHQTPVDPSQLVGQDNLFRCRPRKEITLRVNKGASPLDIARSCVAALVCGLHPNISWDKGAFRKSRNEWRKLQGQIPFVVEDESELALRIERGEVARLRLLGKPHKSLLEAVGKAAIHMASQPVLASGRYELLHYLREEALSHTTHRYGNLLEAKGGIH